MERLRIPNQTWSIVSVAEEGGQLRAFVQRWLGYPKPKQYCAFVGGRSLFQHTLDRAAGLCPKERIVMVIAREHGQEAWPQLEGRAGGTVLVEPRRRETAASIYLSLTYIRARDPQATVVVYPSDHFVYPEHRFLDSVQRAVWTAEWLPDRLVLLGVSPDRLELEYGWIMPGERLDGSPSYQINSVDRIPVFIGTLGSNERDQVPLAALSGAETEVAVAARTAYHAAQDGAGRRLRGRPGGIPLGA